MFPAAQVRTGPRTPLAVLRTASILFALAFAANNFFAQMPPPAMVGVLMLVGRGLVRSTP